MADLSCSTAGAVARAHLDVNEIVIDQELQQQVLTMLAYALIDYRVPGLHVLFGKADCHVNLPFTVLEGCLRKHINHPSVDQRSIREWGTRRGSRRRLWPGQAPGAEPALARGDEGSSHQLSAYSTHTFGSTYTAYPSLWLHQTGPSASGTVIMPESLNGKSVQSRH